MNHSELALLSNLCSGCLVIDLDFSHWDKRIRFVVAKNKESDDEYSELSDIYDIDFLSVSSFSWKAPPFVLTGKSIVRQARWELWACDISEPYDGYAVALRGSGPIAVIECRDITIGTADPKMIRALCPDWFLPGKSFARPSIAEIWTGFRRGQPKSR